MTYTVEGEGGHRHTHRGSEGPAATVGQSWLSPGEESEGKRADWTESPLREVGLRVWGRRNWNWIQLGRGQICSRNQGRDPRGRGDSDRTEDADSVGASGDDFWDRPMGS